MYASDIAAVAVRLYDVARRENAEETRAPAAFVGEALDLLAEAERALGEGVETYRQEAARKREAAKLEAAAEPE